LSVSLCRNNDALGVNFRVNMLKMLGCFFQHQFSLYGQPQ
jgi:hypothetical protein